MLQKIAAHLNLTAPCQSSLTTPLDPALLLDVIVSKHRRRKSQLETLNSTPLYPTEDVLWDESIVPNEYYDYQGNIIIIVPYFSVYLQSDWVVAGA